VQKEENNMQFYQWAYIIVNGWILLCSAAIIWVVFEIVRCWSKGEKFFCSCYDSRYCDCGKGKSK